MPDKTRESLIFIIYWIPWPISWRRSYGFIALNRQNKLMTRYEIGQLDKNQRHLPGGSG